MGCAAKIHWKEIALEWIRDALIPSRLKRTAGWGIFVCALPLILHLSSHPLVKGGEWIDQAFSETLTRKLGYPTRVRTVRFLNWTKIEFGHLEIHNAEGRLLVAAASGAIRLKKASFRKDGFFETEFDLRRAELTRDYYRSAPALPFWVNFLRRPLTVEHLSALVRQNDERTTIQILECRSPDVQMEGALTFEKSGDVHDELKTSMSPWRYLSAVV
jgi:hypothetical protein